MIANANTAPIFEAFMDKRYGKGDWSIPRTGEGTPGGHQIPKSMADQLRAFWGMELELAA